MAAGFSQILMPSTTVTDNGNTAQIAGIPGIIGAIGFINVSDVSGTGPSITFTTQMYDPASDTWIDISSVTAITGTGMNVFITYPGLNAANNTFGLPLPPNFRIAWALTGTDSPSVTFSIGMSYLP